MSKVIETMTRAEAAASRRPGLRERPCVARCIAQWEGPEGWHMQLGWTRTQDMAKAACISVAKAIALREYISDIDVLHILDYPQPPNDGRLWLNREQWGGLPLESRINTLRCKIKHLDGTWYSVQETPVTQEGYATNLVVTHAGADLMFDTDLLLVPGVDPNMADVNEPVDPNAPPKRICTVQQVLSAPVLQLLTSSPENPEVRAIVRAAARRKIPDELKTSAEIIDWIEFNIQPVNTKRPAGYVEPAAQATAEASITVEVECSDVENGTCQYRDARTGTYICNIPEAWIMEQINMGYGVQDIVQHATAYARDDAGEAYTPEDMESTGNIRYDRHDLTDNVDWSARVRPAAQQFAREQLEAFLRQRLSREELVRMGLEQPAPQPEPAQTQGDPIAEMTTWRLAEPPF